MGSSSASPWRRAAVSARAVAALLYGSGSSSGSSASGSGSGAGSTLAHSISVAAARASTGRVTSRVTLRMSSMTAGRRLEPPLAANSPSSMTAAGSRITSPSRL